MINRVAFTFWQIMVLWTFTHKFLCVLLFLTLLVMYYLRVEKVGDMVTLYLSNCFFTAAHHFTFPTAAYEGSNFSVSSYPHQYLLLSILLLNYSHLAGMTWCLTVVWFVFFSLMTNDASVYACMHLLGIIYLLWRTSSSKTLAII